MNENDLKITYTAKELLARIDLKLDSIDGKLEHKVDLREFEALTGRVDALQKRVNERFTIIDDREKNRDKGLGRRDALVMLGLMALAILVNVLIALYTTHTH